MPRVFHRYAAHEMCGTLPAVLYKILPTMYAQRFVNTGEMMWSTLTWFQNEEDPTRGDTSEGMRRYFPSNGLELTRLSHNGRPDNTRIVSPDEGTVYKAAQSDHIFIYSMTLAPTLAIGDPADRVCVEIFDPDAFKKRLGAAVARHRSARAENLIHHEVNYWASERPPEEVWALPDRLTMHKHEEFSGQQEYRLAVGTRANVFDFENIEGFIVHKDYRWPRLKLDPQAHRLKLRLGSLADCCRSLP